MLKPIGWWIETLADEKLPAPQEFVGELLSERRTALANYLSDGLRLIQYRGYSWCRFACGVARSKMGSWDITDGVWVWPEGLAHYVQVHQVILPDEFMSRALSGASATSSGPPRDYDADYWTHWCAARRVPAIKEGLRRTQLAAQARVSALKAERIDALEKPTVSRSSDVFGHSARAKRSRADSCAPRTP